MKKALLFSILLLKFAPIFSCNTQNKVIYTIIFEQNGEQIKQHIEGDANKKAGGIMGGLCWLNHGRDTPYPITENSTLYYCDTNEELHPADIVNHKRILLLKDKSEKD